MLLRFPQSSTLAAFIILLISACEGTFNQRMGKVSGTIKEVDSTLTNVSKTATKFADGVESYVDTTTYKKDSAGIWHEKPEVKKKQEQHQGGVFDSIFK